MNRFLSLGLAACALVAASSVAAQTAPPVAGAPAEKPKDVKIEQLTIESAPLPGSTQPWAKLVTKFRSVPRWADGIVFNYQALLGANNQFKVVQGVVRYANVKGGNSRAVMYISPNTVERFGPPIAITVRAFFKDEQIDEFVFRGPGQIPANWERQIDRIQGLLLNVLQTPWVMTDYAASPDILAVQ